MNDEPKNWGFSNPDTPLSYAAAIVAERMYLDHRRNTRNNPKTDSELTDESVFHVTHLPLRNWVIGLIDNFRNSTSDFEHFARKVNTKDQTLPTQREIEHPYFWIKMLRHNQLFGQDYKDDRSTFFYTKAVETALNHLATDFSSDARESMLTLVFNLTINHTPTYYGQPSTYYTEQNTQALAAIGGDLWQATRCHMERTLAEPTQFESKIAIMHRLLIKLDDQEKYLTNKGVLADIENDVKTELHQFISTSVNNLFHERISPSQQLDTFKRKYLPAINSILKEFSVSQSQIIYDEICDCLLAKLKQEKLSTSETIELLQLIVKYSQKGTNTKWTELRNDVWVTLNAVATSSFKEVSPKQIPFATRFTVPSHTGTKDYRYVFTTIQEGKYRFTIAFKYGSRVGHRSFQLSRQRSAQQQEVSFISPQNNRLITDTLIEASYFYEALEFFAAFNQPETHDFRIVSLSESAPFFPIPQV